jgi:curli biogenesis system outer membrane secretion channel CsgG/peptidoglycan hydrolase-like protein with peptidoglycan-binding domain
MIFLPLCRALGGGAQRPFSRMWMMASLLKDPRRLAAGFCATAMLAGCVTDAPKPETATVAAAVKTPASKAVTNFTPALRCMDDLLLAYGKRDIVITTAGIPDSTGKVQTGTKEMLITAASKMSIKSKALSFIDYDTERSDLLALFQDIQAAGAFNHKLPNYYIRGAITQLDENAIDSQVGGGIALPFLDAGVSKDQVSSVVSIDMNVGETTSRMIMPGVNASNSLVVTRAGKSADLGGRIGKAGFSFNMSLNKAEGLGAGVRALVELGMIELVGKLTGTPYWKCLQIEKTNPVMMEQAREWYDGMSPQDLVKLVQRKLAGTGAYSGAVNGANSRELAEAVGRYQSENGLVADGRINFDLYYSLLDSDQAPAPDPTPKSAAIVSPPAGGSASQVLSLKLDSDRGTHPAYRVKEMLQARVQLSSDGILYCYYRDVSGAIARIYPNRFNPDPFVKANKSMTLPPENSPFKIKFDQAGREQIACYASGRDLALPQNLKGADLTPLKVGSMDEIANAFRKSNPSVAEAKLDISIQ